MRMLLLNNHSAEYRREGKSQEEIKVIKDPGIQYGWKSHDKAKPWEHPRRRLFILHFIFDSINPTKYLLPLVAGIFYYMLGYETGDSFARNVGLTWILIVLARLPFYVVADEYDLPHDGDTIGTLVAFFITAIIYGTMLLGWATALGGLIADFLAVAQIIPIIILALICCIGIPVGIEWLIFGRFLHSKQNEEH